MYREKQQGRSIFTVRNGLVKLYSLLPDGQQRIVRLLKPGDIAGLEVLLNQRYQHFAETIDQTDLCKIPVTAITNLQADHPLVYQALFARWQESVEEADKFITWFSTGPAPARMARLLIHLYRNENPSWYKTLSREDMGSILGVTTETASRTIAGFKRKGLINVSANTITLLDPERLQKLSRGSK